MKKYFSNINTIDELKKLYRKLCQLNHPDNGGSTSIMQEINRQYTELFNLLKNKHNAKVEQEKAANPNTNSKPINECPEEFIYIINELLKLKGLTVELCGSWIWISGDTKQYKEVLKSIGCRWASKKKMWYWRNEKDACHGNRKNYTMADIRFKYGSESYSTDTRELLYA